jgi:GTP-binding protein
MIPVIALVGRPNVGKSTLFNRLTRSRDALVANLSGLTRDRKYGDGHLGDKPFIVIDTGGITGDEEGIDAAMAQQSLTAIEESDIVFFVVDAKSGLTAVDELLAKKLRVSEKSCWLVVNKVDGQDSDIAMADFYRLGLKQVRPIAAVHNRGVRSLIDEVMGGLSHFKLLEHDEGPDAEVSMTSSDQADDLVDDGENTASFSDGLKGTTTLQSGIKIALIGRPNVGKSTLVNRLLGEERVVVYDQPGTTRDSVYIPYERRGEKYTLIDTAGIRRRKSVKETVEKFSIVKTLQAVKDAHVVILVIDARDTIVEQDLHLLGYAIDAGRALIIAVNKWDGMSSDDKSKVKNDLQRRLNFIDYASVHFISAKHGTGVGNLYTSVEKGYQSAMAKWSTNRLTEILQDAVADHQPPVVASHRIKLRYAHQGGSNPPIIVVHGNKTADLPNSYKRYLENTFRKVLKVVATPIRFEFKSGDNPFSGLSAGTRKNKTAPKKVNTAKSTLSSRKKTPPKSAGRTIKSGSKVQNSKGRSSSR